MRKEQFSEVNPDRNQKIINEINNYEKIQCMQIENLQLYKTMIDNKQAIFMDFNSNGKLVFLSCNLKHQVISKLKKFWKLKNIEITDLFYKDKKLQSLIKKGSEGKLNQAKFYDLDDLKAKVTLSDEKFIERI